VAEQRKWSAELSEHSDALDAEKQRGVLDDAKDELRKLFGREPD